MSLTDVKKEKHDPFIDFLKAYAIICVILAHALPDDFRQKILFPIWGAICVPQFFLIQSYHVFKKERSEFYFRNSFKRYLMPFIIIQILIITIMCLIKGITIDMFYLTDIIKSGGWGPGSYFIWVFLQFSIILPLVRKSLIVLKSGQLLILFVTLCVSLDIVCSFLNLPEWLYRLLPIRYFFLVYLSIVWVREGISITWGSVALSVISIFATLFFMNRPQGLEPLFPETDFMTSRWICYFYISNVFMWLLRKAFDCLAKYKYVMTLFLKIGKCSYEIYLVQMGIFFFIPTIYPKLFGTAEINTWIELMVGLVVSIFGGFIFRYVYSKTEQCLVSFVKQQRTR